MVSSAIPLVQGGGRFIVDWLAPKLVEAGHEVETVWIPQVDDPATLFQQMLAFRLMDLNDSFDRVITFRPPAHVVRHHTKIVWFIHHIRQFYDLWETDYNPLPRTAYWEAYRANLKTADTKALDEAHKIFTNSAIVQKRLKTFNGVDAEVLYPPVLAPERFFAEAWGGEIAFICRVEHHKRQHLAIEAMKLTRTPVRLRIAGRSASAEYADYLRKLIALRELEDRVTLDLRWISEGEKTSLLSTALAAIYVPLDEDSYGYPTIEAALARKTTVTVSDSGGVPEFIIDGVSGIVADPDPAALADAFDRVWTDRKLARDLGQNAYQRLAELRIHWEHVIERLTS
ncbi:glycosyltransferase family 4 protein [Microvirga aerophila]|uniref:glycosyltransferase family 4 protein n=1 Tax=Microvirga aerophila TaxID=670291 RepID=UPI001FE1654E|nr:glycosyltransferase family 4 protein [Microvirga aerophila]